jgi:RNA methyltransferase, TrmH family
LRSVKGRREQRRFAFEGPTLLDEARRSGFTVEEVYATQSAYDATPAVRELDAMGTPTFIVDDRVAASISDLRTPSGIVALGSTRLCSLEELFGRGSPLLVLADVGDPANAGTLLRSADAFGCRGVVFGRLGIDPYHPKLVRSAMGALFRLPLAVSDPPAVAAVAASGGFVLVGLAPTGAAIARERWRRPVAVIVGHERRGLARWQSLCGRVLAIPMTGPAESLSAAVAGSIALYEASRPRAASS